MAPRFGLGVLVVPSVNSSGVFGVRGNPERIYEQRLQSVARLRNRATAVCSNASSVSTLSAATHSAKATLNAAIPISADRRAVVASTWFYVGSQWFFVLLVGWPALLRSHPILSTHSTQHFHEFRFHPCYQGFSVSRFSSDLTSINQIQLSL